MAVHTINGNDFKHLLRAALVHLKQSEESINALNVFPVPDGDTGTNMFHTLQVAVEQAEKTGSDHLGMVAHAAARGALLGARGNSGVILSQFLHGFANSLKEKEKATARDIVKAFQEGFEVASRAVLRPVEGTILTVIKKFAEGAWRTLAGSENLLKILAGGLKEAQKALEHTPNQLPVLREAGVVDAGGKGFVVILEGIFLSLKKTDEEDYHLHQREELPEEKFLEHALSSSSDFTYCTELLIKGTSLPLEKIREVLDPWGDCLLVVGDSSLAKVHIHTNHPGSVLEYCLQFGSLHDIKINNMLEQQEEMIRKREATNPAQQTKSFGIISVASGDGLIEIMKEMGADVVVTGGQTMNPSAGEILRAIEHLSYKEVIVLPNNKNVIHAARQAAKLSEKKRVVVIPTKTIPQGLAALLTLHPEDDLDRASKKMSSAVSNVLTGEITKAVRNATYRGMEINKGQFIGIWEGEIKVKGNDFEEVLEDLLRTAGVLEGEGRLVAFYFGKDIDIDRAKEVCEKLSKNYPQHEFEMHYGGQPVYHLIISVE